MNALYTLLSGSTIEDSLNLKKFTTEECNTEITIKDLAEFSSGIAYDLWNFGNYYNWRFASWFSNDQKYIGDLKIEAQIQKK